MKEYSPQRYRAASSQEKYERIFHYEVIAKSTQFKSKLNGSLVASAVSFVLTGMLSWLPGYD